MSTISSTIILSANSSWYLYNFRSSTVKAFINEGYKVVCLAPKDNFSKRLKSLGCEFIHIRIDNKGTNPLRDIFLLLKMFYIYKKIKPKLVFHFTIKNNIYGTIAAYLANTKSVNNITGLGTAFIRKNIISLVVKLLYKISQPLASSVYCQNDDDYDFLLKEKLVPSESLKKLPGSGVDVSRFDPRLKNKYLKAQSDFRFLFSGRVLADKGFNELVTALGLINKEKIRCNLWVCGFADDLNKSSISLKQIFEYQDKYQWFKWLGSVDAIEETLAQVDCLVLPSYREGMPRSVLEACSLEIPVVATNVSGCRNIISHNFNGLLCEPRNTKSLKSALELMLNFSSDRRKEMGKRGRERILKYYDEKFVVQAALKELLF